MITNNDVSVLCRKQCTRKSVLVHAKTLICNQPRLIRADFQTPVCIRVLSLYHLFSPFLLSLLALRLQAVVTQSLLLQLEARKDWKMHVCRGAWRITAEHDASP